MNEGVSRIYRQGDFQGGKKLFGLWPAGTKKKIHPLGWRGPELFGITHDIFFHKKAQKYLFCVFRGFYPFMRFKSNHHVGGSRIIFKVPEGDHV